jgi:hypothetical protein
VTSAAIRYRQPEAGYVDAVSEQTPRLIRDQLAIRTTGQMDVARVLPHEAGMNYPGPGIELPAPTVEELDAMTLDEAAGRIADWESMIKTYRSVAVPAAAQGDQYRTEAPQVTFPA